MAGADTSKDDDVLADIKDEFENARECWSRNYDAALDDFRFSRLHEHWPTKIKAERQKDGRPCLTIPLLPPIMRQVVNDGRQNKPGIKVSAADSDADPETAEIFNGLIRQIERSSHADVAYDTALDHNVTGGFGWLKVNLEYASDDTFEQDIVIETVSDAFSITPDPDSTAADSSDWCCAFETVSMSEQKFKRKYKDADPVSFADLARSGQSATAARKTIDLCHAWSRTEDSRKIVALSPPRADAPEDAVGEAMRTGLIPETLVVDLSVYEDNKALFDALGVSIIGQPRDVPTYKVQQRICSGADVLKTIEWAGKYIPIIPVYGSDVTIEGERTLEGIVRAAKDEQRRHNFFMSAATEKSAMAPLPPFVGPVGAFVTDATKWAEAHRRPYPYIEYDTVDAAGRPTAPPQRQDYAGMPVADVQMAIGASESIKSITGVHNASLGAPSNETSGRAIFARQREGDTGTFHYVDNLSRGIRWLGVILIDLIPKVYSTPRILRVLGPDGAERQVAVNQPTTVQREGPDGELEEIERTFDLTAGKYDLDVKAGPSFTTQREEFVALVTEVIRSFPQAAPVLLDLVVKNYDLPDADEVVKRLEALMPPQLQGESPEAQQLKAQIQRMAEMMGQLKAENASLKADRSLESRKLDIDADNAETARLKAIAPKGVPYDPAQMAPVVVTSLLHILQSPDILQAIATGAPQDQIGAMVAQRMAAPQMAQEPPAQAAA